MFKRIDVKAAHEQMSADSSVQTIDVRRPDEYEQVHAEGFELIPLDQLQSGAYFDQSTLDPNKPLVIICRSGARSATACQLFVDRGFKDVANVEGGTIAWVESGLPHVKASQGSSYVAD